MTKPSPYLSPLRELSAQSQAMAGAKAVNLAGLAHGGFTIPDGFVVTTQAYRDFLSSNGLEERLQMELNRKAFSDMRWEELWDAGLRIRNLFLRQPLPPGLEEQLGEEIKLRLGDRPLVLRSSSPQEDSAKASFAGLHASVVNVRSLPMVLEALRQVWASLWSDAALLYREEIGLNPQSASMAVICQELVGGEASGVMFTRSPTRPEQTAIEAVHGLNEGLVDGRISPDRWLLDRTSGKILDHHVPETRSAMLSTPSGGTACTEASASGPPLHDSQLRQLFSVGQQLEEKFGVAQDIEWTFQQGRLYLLQARPITTVDNQGDDRQWYLSLKRRLDELEALQPRIEHDLLPAMLAEAETLAALDLTSLPDKELLRELASRQARYDYWHGVYYQTFIPFAHGMRLFGEFYNDHLKPDDPYAFMDLLTGEQLQSKQRNRQLEALAGMLRANPERRNGLVGEESGLRDPEFAAAYQAFVAAYGDLSVAATGYRGAKGGASVLSNILLELADQPAGDWARPHRPSEEEFLKGFASGQERSQAKRLLTLAKASYRLRDDDNIVLGRIEAAWLTAQAEAARRALLCPNPRQGSVLDSPPTAAEEVRVEARQLLGQPAAKGVASGPARIVRQHRDLAEMKAGEILVCDAIDPNMTFAIPLAGGIVERRGGMLIHGAIIAREYGLPCVTGIPEACERIRTGDPICVDGFLGIVTIQSS